MDLAMASLIFLWIVGFAGYCCYIEILNHMDDRHYDKKDEKERELEEFRRTEKELGLEPWPFGKD